MYFLDRLQLVPASQEETFRFFEDPRNLARITPDWLALKIVKLDPPPLRAGFRIEYRIRWLRLPPRGQTLIREYEPSSRAEPLMGPRCLLRIADRRVPPHHRRRAVP